jgi:hypothetical protein
MCTLILGVRNTVQGAAQLKKAIDHLKEKLHMTLSREISAADPDPYVFGPLGSGSVSQRNGYGSGSFHHQAKIERKNLDSYFFVTFL